ncbi:sensor histidine kinase [Rhizomonospora bruguierae]|uniref:sensor histidine kinase n=1 Tax=Rhizomonospora bruguierae TaxID=1581705 RepID=UPI001BCD7433|nr:histidine kinase [Micromonospora sp. NBRC 107566]
MTARGETALPRATWAPGLRVALPRLTAWGMAALAAALVGAGAWVLTLGAGAGMVAYFAIGCLLAGACVALGVLIAVKRPANPVGALLTLVGLVAIAIAFSDLYRDAVARRPGTLPVWPLLVTASQGAWMLHYVPASLLMLVFPDGRLLPGRRWRVAAAGVLAVPAAFILLAGLDPTPFPAPYAEVGHAFGTPSPGLARVLGPVSMALLPGLLALLVVCATAMVIRYRRAATAVARAQLKWFALGALFLPGTLLLCWLSYLLVDGPELILIGLAGTLIAIPAATAIAILRHDLYDVDRALSAAVTYGVVTAGLLAFYTAATFVAGLVAGRSSPVAAAAATAVSALALAPLRSHVQHRVDRRLYPARQAALAAIEDLRARIHAGQAAPERLEETLRAALRDPDLRIGYHLPGTDELLGAAGTPFDSAAEATPIRLGGLRIGVLVRGRAGGSPELMREIADACALLVEVVRLRLEVRRALLDVEASRARLLRAGYAERLRLERDLHDGAQQRLVSLGMALRLAQRHLPETDVAGLLDQAVTELGTAVAELRQIAQGLRPSSLDGGLPEALAMLARSVPIPATVDVDPELHADPVAEDVATTAYYVASEAVANIVKHAAAGSIHLSASRRDGRLTVAVRDDGVGGATVRPGAGLAGLADRVSAAGGALTVTSRPGHGTLVQAAVPCGS